MYAEGMSATLRTAIDVAAGAATQAAAIYVRQSRKKADGSEASPAVQLEECQTKAGSMGVLPLPVYEDLGISGYDPKAERPGFDRMLRDARAGKFSHVLVYYMSRFSRQEPLEVLAVVRELWAYGVTITSVTEGTFRPDDFGSLISLLVRLEGNHKESSLKSQNVRKTKKKARELGGYMGGPPPYGFTASKVLRNGVAVQVLEPHPVEAPIVAELVAFILANRDGKPDKHGKHPASKLSAVAWMNANPKAKPHRAKEWNEASVHRILIDPRLAGFAADYVYYKAADEERRRKTREYQIVRDEHGKEVIGNKAIVSPADWYALQAWMDSRKSAGRTSPGESLLAGSKLLYCECGKTLTRFGPVGYPVNYKCPRKRTDMVGRTHEGGNSIAAHKVDEWLARRVMARVLNADIDDPETLVILAEATRRYGQRVEAPATAGERTELVRARAADTKALEDLYDREEAGDYNDPVGRKRFRERKDRITTRLEAANARLIELDNLDTPSLPIEIWAGEEPEQDPIGEGSWWHGATLDERRDFLRLFVDRVTVKKAAHRGGNFLGVEYNHDARLSLEWARPPMPDDE
jgi:DNA invertase Pin-like site-specific DNA recombinase